MADEFTPCSIEGCNRNAHWRAGGSKSGLCRAHVLRLKVHGDALGGRTPNGALEKFLRTVAFEYAGDECLIWPYGKSNNGYGTIHFEGRKKQFVHRLVCEHVNGPPPASNMDAAHSCGNRSCCNPQHLRWASRVENMQDAQSHGTIPKGERRSNAKFRDADVREIRILLKTQSITSIAARYGVSWACIYDISRGRCWASVA